MPSDALLPLPEVAARLGVDPEHVVPYGRGAAKIHLDALDATPGRPPARARLVLVSAITPTPAGEGKTTTAIGLADALVLRGHRACVALREPSMGPALGMKGGATGGGRARLEPRERIDLHFTGDLHAVAAAHNLLAALVDNHLHHGNARGIEHRHIDWPRVVDLNDRALRHVVVGLGGSAHGVPREARFDITAASEIMAVVCLARDADDLRARLGRMIIGQDVHRCPVTAAELEAHGAMLALLSEAMHPNLVQTAAGTPALVHGGPFANIAHGCSSAFASRMGLRYTDWTVTEAGFGFDLGAEKFFDIKCRATGLDADAVVLVATVRALKMHGGVKKSALDAPNAAAVEAGVVNLEKHIENVRHFDKEPVVALNRFAADTPEEIAAVRACCEQHEVAFVETHHFADGGEGALALADAVVRSAEAPRPWRPLYAVEASIPEKISAIARAMYGAWDVAFTKPAEADLRRIERLGLADLPICVAKAPSSLSDDPALHGRPRDFQVTVRGLDLKAGAGFIVALTGDVLRMPGLPREPLASRLDLIDGVVRGLR